MTIAKISQKFGFPHPDERRGDMPEEEMKNEVQAMLEDNRRIAGFH
jgi:hypothetical protein